VGSKSLQEVGMGQGPLYIIKYQAPRLGCPPLLPVFNGLSLQRPALLDSSAGSCFYLEKSH
jgi:hypothetical protein